MKGLVSALAAVSLVFFPLTAAAQRGGMGGGGHFGGGHFSGGGHFGGGHFSGGHFSGGFGGGGFHGGFSHGGFGHDFHHHFHDGAFPFFGGFALGLALDPWFYGGYGGPWSPYPDTWYYNYYSGPYDDGPYYDGGPPPRAAAPQACGQWDWRADQNRYVWTTMPCAAAPPPAPEAPAAPPQPPPPN